MQVKKLHVHIGRRANPVRFDWLEYTIIDTEDGNIVFKFENRKPDAETAKSVSEARRRKSGIDQAIEILPMGFITYYDPKQLTQDLWLSFFFAKQVQDELQETKTP